MNKAALSLGLSSVLLAAVCCPSPVSAQSGHNVASVSLNVANAPIADALRSLFQDAGIHNFIIEVPLAGRINARLQRVPFTVALREILSASATPLMVAVEDGVYHVRLRQPGMGDDLGEMRFYKISLKYYDALMIARLATHRDGLIEVPPNYPVSATSAAPSPVSASVPAVPGSPATEHFSASPETGLPDGVKRIFALQSDNSLVIEATPKGFAELTDLPLASEGYEVVN